MTRIKQNTVHLQKIKENGPLDVDENQFEYISAFKYLWFVTIRYNIANVML